MIKAKNMMIILDGDNASTLHTCACDECEALNINSYLTGFVSPEHAIDDGWVYTDDSEFCPPWEDCVWVCPKCVEDYV